MVSLLATVDMGMLMSWIREEIIKMHKIEPWRWSVKLRHANAALFHRQQRAHRSDPEGKSIS